MNVLRAFTVFCLLIITFSVPSYAEEVLAVLWDDTSGPKVIFKRLKSLHPDAKITYINARRDKNVLIKTLRNYDYSKFDVVYSEGTTGTKIVKGYLKQRKPHVFSSVSAPVRSKIVKSLKKPGENITGVKLFIDLETQIDIFLRIKSIKTIALWHDPREFQSLAVLKKMVQIFKGRGVKPVLFRIIPDAQNFDAMLAKASEDSNKLDALYFVPGYSFHSNYKKLHTHLSDGLLTLSALNFYVKNGSSMALSASPDERNHAAADLISLVLKGARAGETPVSQVTRKNAFLYVNEDKLKAANVLGLDRLGMQVIKMKVGE